LDHWVYPGWILDQGAWEKKSTVDKWMVNARRIVTRYKGLGVIWITINEPTEYISRDVKYRNLNIIQQAFMTGYLISAHKQAYDMIHSVDPGALVSSNLAYQPPPLQAFVDVQFFDQVIDKIDFIALDYYYGLSLDNWSVALALFGNIWDIKSQPDGLYYAMKAYAKKAPGKPFYIVENGMPSDNGVRNDGYTRSSHLLDHIYWLQRAAADGLTVIGYNYWSLTDNYEWGTYRSRFGLYKVDVLTDPTLTRQPTDAVETYKQIIANNGVPDGYTPVMPPSLCNLAAGFDVCVGQIVSLLHPVTKSPTVAPTKGPTPWWWFSEQGNDPIAEPASSVNTGGVVGGTVAGFAVLGAFAAVVIRRRRSSRSVEQQVESSRQSVVLTHSAMSSENPVFVSLKV
jgi:beta-glucosidase